MDRTDNETWLIEAAHGIVEKKAAAGIAELSPRERLIHCSGNTRRFAPEPRL